MTPTHSPVFPADLGARLRIARDAAGLTQAAAAKSVDMVRTTLVAIEQGARKVRMEELIRFADLYRIEASRLLRREAVHPDLAPRFRKVGVEPSPAAAAATTLLSDLARAETELEWLLGTARERILPPMRPILPGDIQVQAEQDASELRSWLGLGDSSIADVPALLERRLGVRVFQRPLGRGVSGLYAYDDSIGACMLFNANEPRPRRNLTAAHELAHLLTSRETAEVLLDGDMSLGREERHARAFAPAFLMPPRAVMDQFRDILAGAANLTRRHVILLAQIFAVSREAMVRRLETLKLMKAGSWEWFQAHGGITDEQARQVLGEAAVRESHDMQALSPVSVRLHMLAYEAWSREIMSEGQLADLLRLDRVALRELLDVFQEEQTSACGVPVEHD